jgi:SMC interacting uncharacterized protein involved in chromosome segregation
MSPTQFTEAITQMNTVGVPVTVRYTKEDGVLPDPPYEDVRETFQEEFKSKIKDILDAQVRALDGLQAVLKEKRVRKSDIKQVSAELEAMKRDITANLSYIDRCFHEQMEKSVHEAKGEIEGFFESKIRSLGSKALVYELEKGLINTNLLEE